MAKKVILFIFLSVTVVFAETNFQDFLKYSSGLYEMLPKSNELVGYYYFFGTNEKSDAKFLMKKENNLVHTYYDTSDMAAHFIFSHRMKLISAEYNILEGNDKLIEEIGHDRRTISLQHNGYKSKHFLNGEEVKSMLTENGDGHGFVDSDSVSVLLQVALLSGIRDNIKSKTHVSPILREMDMEYSIVESKNPMELAEYDYPKEMFGLFTEKNGYYVFVVELNGILGFFVKQKYYIVFEKDYPHTFTAYFGGAKETAEFVFFLNKTVKIE